MDFPSQTPEPPRLFVAHDADTVALPHDPAWPDFWPEWSPDGQLIADHRGRTDVVEHNAGVWLLDPAGGAPPRQIVRPAEWAASLGPGAWAATAAHLGVGVWERSAARWGLLDVSNLLAGYPAWRRGARGTRGAPAWLGPTMPYLRLTCPELDAEQRQAMATRLTDAINDLLFDPRSRLTRDQLRERTTVHFTPYGPGELFIGGRTPVARGAADITLELSDWGMSARQRRRLAAALTPVLAELFSVPLEGWGNLNIRFHTYHPSEFAVGGRLLSDIVPLVGRVMRRLAG